jgi:hypothetical protein
MLSFSLHGEMAEWSIASDLKSDELTGSVSSNLTFSFQIPTYIKIIKQPRKFKTFLAVLLFCEVFS